MTDVNSQLPVKLTDGTLTATIRDAGSNDALNVALVDAAGNQITSFGGGTQYTEDTASAGGESLTLAGAVRRDTAASSSTTDGDYSTINTDASGRLWTHAQIASGDVASGAFASGSIASGAVASGAFAAGSIVAGAVAAGAGSFVKLEDVASADADAGVPAMAVRKATPANTSGTDGDYEMLQMSAGRLWTSSTIDNLPANPVPVYVTGGSLSGTEVNDYETEAALAAAATSDHDYTVTGTTMLLKQILASASGRIKVELKVGPVGTLVTKAVWFNSTANPNIDVTFAQAIEVPVASTGTVRVAITNLEAVAMDVYSLIVGNDI